MKGQRGRKSAASLSIVPVTGIQRPEPPPELSAEESAVWTATTRAMKPDWFGPETRPILAAYCLHLVTANMVAQRLNDHDRCSRLPPAGRYASLRDQDGAVDPASHAAQQPLRR